MRRAMLLIFCILTIGLVSFTQYDRESVVLDDYVIELEPLIADNNAVNARQAPDVSGDLRDFMKSIAFMESSGVHDTVSANGMLGKYQFSYTTLRHLGYEGSVEEFLNDEFVQDSMMIDLLRNNRRSLRVTISRFDGKWKNDVYVTKSGILAGAHLVGVGGVLSFFYPDRYDFDVQDSNGMRVEDYMEKFGNYNVGTI